MEQRENGDGESGSEGLTESITPSEDYYALRRALLGLTENERNKNVEQQDVACCCLEVGKEGFYVSKEEKLDLEGDLSRSLLETHIKETLTKGVKLNKEWISELDLTRKRNLHDIVRNDKIIALKQTQVSADQGLSDTCGTETCSMIASGQRQSKSTIEITDCKDLSNRFKESQNKCNRPGYNGSRKILKHFSSSCINREQKYKEQQHLQNNLCRISESSFQPSDNDLKDRCLRNIRGLSENMTRQGFTDATKSFVQKYKNAPECSPQQVLLINESSIIEIEMKQSSAQTEFTVDYDEARRLCRKNSCTAERDSGPAKISLQSIVFQQLKYYYMLYLDGLGTSKNDCNNQTKECKNLIHNTNKLEQRNLKDLFRNVDHNMEESFVTNSLNEIKKENESENVWKALQEVLEKVISQHLLISQYNKQTLNSSLKSTENMECGKSNDEKLQYAIRDYIRLYLGPKRSSCDVNGRTTVMLNNDTGEGCVCNYTKSLNKAETAGDKDSQQQKLEHLPKIPKCDFHQVEEGLNGTEDLIESLKQILLGLSPGSESYKSCVEARTNTLTETIIEAPEEFRVPDAQPLNDHSLEPTDHDNNIKFISTEAVDTSHRSHSPVLNVLVGITTPTPASSSPEVVSEDVHSMALLSTLRGLKVTMADCTGSIGGVGVGVEIDSRAPGCSRGTDADRERTLDTKQKTDGCCCCSAKGSSCDRCNSVVESRSSPLRWKFKNGRLVFVEEEEEVDEGESEGEKEQDGDEIIYSKELNRRITGSVGGNSRLKYLEEKLKQAGIQDCNPNETEPVNDSTTNNEKADDDDDENDLIPYDNEDCNQFFNSPCEFDVRQVSSFSGFEADEYYVVYDEFDHDCDHEETMRGEGGIMGTEGERTPKQQHNPDHDNLKSLLKRPGKSRDGVKKNRVVFNENRNEFFDADYIILIREECDYDDDDDDVCCCNQHEMVRLTCCEPNCNCNSYSEGNYQESLPQSPKFAPPLEFVDAVTLSPPEGYKDMELEEQQLALQQMAKRGQRTAVCKECSASHDDQVDGTHSDNDEVDEETNQEAVQEKEKTDQSQQTTPTTPVIDTANLENARNCILETITMTTVTEQRILKEDEDERKHSCSSPSVPTGGSPISGILKGGKLWKQQGSLETNGANKASSSEIPQLTDSSVTSDEEGTTRRSVRFIESSTESKRDICDGAPDSVPEENVAKQKETHDKPIIGSAPLESTEMMLTFKLGNHVLISNNSLKPNSAVRQLFPCTKPLPTKAGDEEAAHHQYLVTAESLKAFEEAKRSKLPQIIQSGETDDSIKRAIERNTLRRSLIRYEPKSKKNQQKTDNSLVERIKQLTCDVDDQETERASPPGEEAHNSPEISNSINKNIDKSFSPSSSSTASSNSSSVSSTYKKITDLFGKKDRVDVNNIHNEMTARPPPALPDLGNGGVSSHDVADGLHCPATKVNSVSSESRKQFLSSLAPLTACVSSMGAAEDHYYHGTNSGERNSLASSVGTEYSLEDIDEGLKTDDEETKRITPDVLAGTPSASESGDELAMFVQQDASRIERIKKKYQPDTNNEEDDEHDDYGFNRRPSVRGIKPRFGSTTEILQQIQSQLQPPPPSVATANRTTNTSQVSWPYYSETNIAGMDNTKQRNANIYQYEDAKKNVPNYRPTTLIEESVYQNCAYRGNVNHVYAPVMRIGSGCSDYYHQSLPRNRNGRPQSPPPLDVSKTYHHTMVYIPYNHIEGYQPPNPYYTQNEMCYTRVTNQNQINKRYIDPAYVGDDHHYAIPPPKHLIRVSYSSQMANRSESPLPGQFSTARSTQTPSTCNYYPVRYRPIVGPWQGEPTYAGKVNRHSYPARFPPSDDTETQQNLQLPNGYRHTIESIPNSPTKPRFIERGVPEGAASVSPQDVSAQTASTMTSPTSPKQQGKPLFYAMNV